MWARYSSGRLVPLAWAGVRVPAPAPAPATTPIIPHPQPGRNLFGLASTVLLPPVRCLRTKPVEVPHTVSAREAWEERVTASDHQLPLSLHPSLPPTGMAPLGGVEAGDAPILVYTDGSCRGNGQTGAVAGIGVYFGPGDPRYGAAGVGDTTRGGVGLLLTDAVPSPHNPHTEMRQSRFQAWCRPTIGPSSPPCCTSCASSRGPTCSSERIPSTFAMACTHGWPSGSEMDGERQPRSPC